ALLAQEDRAQAQRLLVRRGVDDLPAAKKDVRLVLAAGQGKHSGGPGGGQERKYVRKLADGQTAGQRSVHREIVHCAARMATSSRHAVLAGFLGWMLDAFDFFVIVFLYDDLAKEFGVSKKLIIGTVAVTLAFRPVGALIFGALADRFGRRIPLMANV